MIQGYASRTGTRANLRALRDAGWRLLISACGVHRTEGFRYAIDNGAWTAFQKKRPFDESAFLSVVEKLGGNADFIIVPDCVMNAKASLSMAEKWLPRLGNYRLMIAVQNGMQADDVAPWIGGKCGIAIGGDSEWKENTARDWGRLASAKGAACHVLRVNSARRIRICQEANATSFDGSGPSRFAQCLPRLDAAVKQGHFKWG